MTTARVVKAACLALAIATRVAAQRTWVEATGPHLTVISDADAARARDVVWQFEQVRAVIARVWPWIRADMAKPVLVLAARNESSFQALAPAYWEDRKALKPASVSITGYDRTYIAIRSDLKLDDKEGINPFASAYWSYAAQALGGTADGLPPWLLNGVSSLVSNSLVRSDHVQVGRLIPDHLTQLRQRGRMPLAEIVSVARDDPRHSQRAFREVFDAEAWALVHFLMWGENSRHQEELNKYISGLLSGADARTSLASTLGDVSRFENAFKVYVDRDLFAFVRLDTEAGVQRDKFPVRSVPVEEAATMRAAFHTAMKRPTEAKALLAEAQAANAAYGGIDEVMALMADYDNRQADLQQALEKAVAKSGVTWYVPFRLAGVLSRSQDRAPFERVESLLEQAVALNPSADNALGFLAEVKASLGRGAAAMAPAERAIALMPASSAHRLSLARVMRQLKSPQDAMKLAGLARTLARTADERDAAQALLSLLAKETLAPSTPAATSPTSTRPPAPAAGDMAGAPVDGRDGDIAALIGDCNASSETCAKSWPAIAASCDAGASRVACRFAGYVLDAGLGMPADPAKGAAYYKKGCDRDDKASCARLASLEASGRGVPKNVTAALATLEGICREGLQEGCLRLGVAAANSGTSESMVRARTVLKTTCDAGSSQACEVLKKLPPG